MCINIGIAFSFAGFCRLELLTTVIRSVARRGKGIASARKGTSGLKPVG